MPDTTTATTSASSSPLARRTAATWIAGTGAFLLLAAASLFVAVRWRQLPDPAKLAVMGLLTGAFLAGGRWLRTGFPATGGALFHLGAFLLPVDLAALNLAVRVGWRGLLLAEGVLVATVLGWMAARTGSSVLAWASGVGVVATAAGVAALSPLPGPLVLAVAGAVAHATRRHRAACWWSALAGLAPLAGLVATVLLRASGTHVGRGVLVELGLAGRAQWLAAVAAGMLGAVVLGREAAARQDLRLVALAGASLVAGGLTTWVAADPGVDPTLQAGAALFLAGELSALLLGRDRFWSLPARWSAGALEAAFAVVTAAAAAAAVLTGGDRGLGVALGLSALAWSVGAVRRLPAQPASWSAAAATLGHPLGALAAATAVAGVGAGTSSPAATSVALVVAAAGLVAAGSEVAHATAAAFAVCAPPLAWRWPGLAVAVAATGAVVVAEAAVRRSRSAQAADAFSCHVLAAVACCCGAQAALFLLPFGWADVTVALSSGVAVFWALAHVLDRGRRSLGDVARLGMAVPPVAAMVLGPAQALTVAAAATALFVVEALRLDRPQVGLGAAAAVQLVVFHGSRVAGLEMAETGLVLCVAAAVWSGLAVAIPGRWQPPFLVAAVSGVAWGLQLAAAEPRMRANALVVTGALGLAAGLTARSTPLAHGGGGLAVLGVVSHLAQSDVSALEAYVTPVAVHLLAAGGRARRTRPGVSSWVAYGPSVALVGGSGFVERLAGGAGWHALVAGGVGVSAVAVGGWRRLGGPLLLGTGLLVAVTVVESMPALAGVPTWGWLATGGTFLVLVSLVVERSDTSPAAVGRRLVDVVGERFD